jgi:aminomethyltransferase
MIASQEKLKQTPLNQIHRSLKAKMAPFGGWDMPIQYEGILAEYQQTRQRAAVFDISHMGEFIIEGDAVKSGLDRIVTCAIKDMPEKSCRYGTILNEFGGVIDDMIIFRIEAQLWMIVVNGATMETDAVHFFSEITRPGVFTNISYEIGKLDVQGPLARDVLKGIVPGIDKLSYYTFSEFELLGEEVIISRTGYTGELGYEIYFPWDKIEELWHVLLKDDRIKPAGLGARDVLRLEMGYSLYGHELSEDINPLEAGLNKFIDFGKDFVGRKELFKQSQQGLKKKIVGFISENRRSPRETHKIYTKTEEAIGYVTSGTFSPSLEKGIGLGFIDSAKLKEMDNLDVVLIGDEKNKFRAELAMRPFYKKGSLKN